MGIVRERKIVIWKERGRVREREEEEDSDMERGGRVREREKVGAMHHLCLFTLYMLRSYPFSLQTLSLSLDLRS